MKKLISTLLITAGLILIFSPILNKQIIKQRVVSTIEIVDTVTVEEIEENEKQEAVYDYSSIRDIQIISTLSGNVTFDDKSVIGQLIINDLNINLPILKGVTNANLLAGAATMVADLEMGKGNYSLAGHYNKDPSILFGALLDIEIGSIVKITDKRNVYEYIIYDTKLVPDTAFYMLEKERSTQRGRPIISLMTCYYTSKNGNRFFALGELIDEYPYEKEQLNTK